MRILHAIHDFLPRHRAGSEIYACDLAREQRRRHDVFVVAAEYDPATAHGTLRWREYAGLTVIELVNNWEFDRFEDSYASERINAQLRHVLAATAPDVLHVHNLLNLSFDLPRQAKQRGAGTVATLHDYTLVCASGGQRVHASDQHVCHEIDPGRCARCFSESPFSRQMAAGRLTRGPAGPLLGRSGRALRRLAPRLANSAARAIDAGVVEAGDLRRRGAYARGVFEAIDLFVAPSRFIGDEFVRLGAPRDRLQIADYGFAPQTPQRRPFRSPTDPLRIGFVGTLVWHKGVHVLVDAFRALDGHCELHVHGDTGVFPEYAARLRAAAGRAPVVFHGGFGQEHAGEIYGSLDVLVVPSLWPENSPLVIHEAFIHGVPVVAARVGGIPELIEHEVNGLLYEPACSVEALRESLDRLLADRTLIERFAHAMPDVKTIAADAIEWDARYAQIAPDASKPAAMAAP